MIKFVRSFLVGSLLVFTTVINSPIAHAVATDAPIITKVVQGDGTLTVYVAPAIENTQNTWFYQVINNDAGCANPLGNSSTTNTSGAPSSFSLTGLTNGCKYQINVANWNGATSPYTTVYAMPGYAKTSGNCTTYVGNSSQATYLNISAVGTNECLASVTTVAQNVQWIPTAGVSSIWYLAVGGGGAGSRGECSIFWGAGGGGGEVLTNSSYAISSTTSSATPLWLYVGNGGAGSSTQACPSLGGTAYTTPDGIATKIGTTSSGSTIANARGGKGITVNPAANNNSGGKGGNNGNPTYTGYQYAYTNDGCSNANTGCAAGGGGGASASASGLNGGAGVNSTITGSTIGFGGGGAGKNNSGYGTASHGGSAGTTNGGTNAPANQGGGGSDSANFGGYVGGGSGVIYIRYTNPGLTPIFDTPIKTASGYSVNIVNYDANYTWATPTVSSGSVAITSTSGSVRKLTVTGVSSGSSATITQTTSRTGFAGGSATATGTASNPLTTPSAPTVSATANTLKSISVSWTTISNASSYSVKLYNSAGSTLLATISVATLSKTITASDYGSIADNTTYQISLTAIGDGVTYSDSSESTKTSVTTNAAPVAPTISSQPTSASISSGASATFSVTASVTDSGTVTYQWQVSTNSGSTWNNVASNGNSSSYSTGVATVSSNGYQYKVIVTNSKNGSTATTTSSVVTLTVGTATSTITISLPGGATSATYNSAVTITASTSVNGSVNFKVGGTTITGCGTVATSALSATCSWTPSTTGSNALTAVLSPTDSSNYTTSTSVAVNVNVGTAATTTSITVDVGQPEFLVPKNITATASVAGTVNFMFNGKTIPGCFAAATNVSLVATCSWKPAVRTTVTITATLSPTNSAYAPSTSEGVIASIKARTGARRTS